MPRTRRRPAQSSLEELRALEAVHRAGSVTAAGGLLGKGHTGVLYALGSLEARVGLKLLDRTGPRVALTSRGLAFLEAAQRVLGAEAELQTRAQELRSGWEPRLTVVADGVVHIAPIIDAFALLTRRKVPTALRFTSAFLAGVEAAFESEPADVMISVLPPQRHTLASVALPPIPATLVTHSSHPLARGRHTASALAGQMLLTVRGADPRMQLPTAVLEGAVSVFHVTDFGSKKLALLKGLGFGWMPNVDIAAELKRGTLVRVRWEGASTHVFHPRLYHRGERRLGAAGHLFIEAISAHRL